MHRANRIGNLNFFERLLLLMGVLLLSIYAVALVYRAAYSHATVQRFWRERSVAAKSETSSPLPAFTGIPDFRLWSAKRVEAYQAAITSDSPRPLAVLKILSIELEVPVLEGTDDLTLNRAVGHIIGTAAPGANGNIGIAGHRDGFFRGLKNVRLGDTIDLFLEKGNSRYVVDDISIVAPEDVSVLAPKAKPALTLVTCYPFYFVGSAPMRYIIHASLSTLENPPKSVSPGSLGGGGRRAESQ